MDAHNLKLYSHAPLAMKYEGFVMFRDKAALDQVKPAIETIARKIRDLTPAGRKIISTLHALFERSEYKAITRGQIVQALGKKHLTIWDRTLLDRLVHEQLITTKREALPTYTVPELGFQAARGYQITYSMDLDTGFCIAFIKDKAKAKRP